MSELHDLNDEQFAYVDSAGHRHLPVHDDAHVRNAIARFSQTRFESAGAKKKAAMAVLAAARQHSVEVSDDDAVSQATRD